MAVVSIPLWLAVFGGMLAIWAAYDKLLLPALRWFMAGRANVDSLDVEVISSDQDEHLLRLESRAADIPDHQVPTWQDVIERDYYPWDDQPRLIIDTVVVSVDEAVRLICRNIAST